ncbi:MAG: M1 family metallopeptidase [Candidatus Heimdallarchaeota archaeon]|nr:MAG: M1 family metallopeptidase [Candidatus Heimdallarchaeota archaeon]
MRYAKLLALLLILLPLFSIRIIDSVAENASTLGYMFIDNQRGAGKIFESNVLPENVSFSNMSLSVKLNEALSVIEGILTVFYVNNDHVTFDSIPFHLYPSGMQYESRQGEISILNVTTTDSPSISLLYEVFSDQQLMWVNLSSPLEYQQNTSFRIAFTTTLPDGQDRANSYGLDSGQSRVYTCTAFYPIPCVYDKYDGWNTDKYLTMGDPFYFDMAYYDLVIEVPNNMTVVATGELLSSTTIGTSTVYHYNPHYPVREVVFSASRYFLKESQIINGMNISCYYLPHSSSLWEDDALNTTINSFLLFNNSFGAYPYNTFNVVEVYGFYGGMEYPCQVQISESIVDQHPEDYEFFQELIIAHEVAHQWWCQIVGNDQIDWGHLDEGLTCWSTDYYFDYCYPSWHYFDNYWALDTVRTYYENNGLPNRINQSIYNFIDTNMSYRYTAYTKAPLILQKLRLTIGHDDYIAGLRHFFHNYRFHLARFPDLQRSFEIVTGNSLDWFFLPWFDNPYLPSYYYMNVDYNPHTQAITVTIGDLNEDKNEYTYSQQLYLQVMDFQKQEIYHREQFWINGTTTVSLVVSDKDDPGAVLLMYESDVLVQLWSADVTALTFLTDSWFKSNLIELIELSVFLVVICVLSGYIVWGIKKRKFPNKS